MRNTRLLNTLRNTTGACLFGAMLLLTGAGCGQKGPLYLPQEDAAASQEKPDCPSKRCQAEPADHVSETTP